MMFYLERAGYSVGNYEPNAGLFITLTRLGLLDARLYNYKTWSEINVFDHEGRIVGVVKKYG
jgi:hypothetical protein